MGFRYLVLLVGALGLTACGGSGSGNDSSPPVSAPDSLTWQPGVFPNSEGLAARCETPRTGVDPFSNEPFPDRQGSDFEEKMWLRSWTDETYLWFDEVEDNNPDNFSVIEYFEQLRTNEITDSGRPKDNFHFSENTAEYNARTQSGVTSGYGISWAFIRNSAPRELVVRYTEPGSAAALQNIPRGASLIEIDGIDFVNTTNGDEIARINSALFPDNPGSTHQFSFIQADGQPFTVSLTSENVTLVPVQNVRILETDAGRVGYMQFNTFITPSQESLIDTFARFAQQGIDELVLDLRYNGGGSLNLASQISYMIAGPSQTNNRLFNSLVTNGKFQSNSDIAFFDREIDYEEGVFTNRILPSPEMTRVFVLSTRGTCSASESVINGLRGIDVEVVLIGDTTCGKPFGFFPEDNCGTTYFTIQIQSVNDKGFGAYQDGFSPVVSPNFDDELPGCVVADDLSQPLGSTSEPLLSAALNYMVDGACPVVSLTAEERTLSQSTIGDETDQDSALRQRRETILNAIANDSYVEIREQN